MFRLRDFRIDQGLTQKELMGILNISQTSISFVENGTRNLSKEQMSILVGRYGQELIDSYVSESSDATVQPNIRENITHPPSSVASDANSSLIEIISHQQAQMDALLESNTLMQQRIDKLLSIIEKQYNMIYGTTKT